MSRSILVIQGHPDPASRHFCHALAAAYVRGAQAGGHEIAEIEVATVDFPVLRTREQWERDAPPPAILQAQVALDKADHLVILFPLWLGTLPALLKAFLEQVLRPGFAFGPYDGANPGKPRLKGKSARVVVTMGMPALLYRWYFLAHGVRGVERNILRFCGIRPLRETLIGGVETTRPGVREKWLRRLEALGRAGV